MDSAGFRLAQTLQQRHPRSLKGHFAVSIQDQTPNPPAFALEDLRLWVPSSAAQALDAKRLLDITVSLALVILLLPVLAIITLLVAAESRGPVLFCQRRTGMGGRIFGMFKFRSMRVMDNGADVVQATQNDPRVTRTGCWKSCAMAATW